MFHRCYGVAQHRSRRCALNAINVRVWRRRAVICRFSSQLTSFFFSRLNYFFSSDWRVSLRLSIILSLSVFLFVCLTREKPPSMTYICMTEVRICSRGWIIVLLATLFSFFFHARMTRFTWGFLLFSTRAHFSFILRNSLGRMVLILWFSLYWYSHDPPGKWRRLFLAILSSFFYAVSRWWIALDSALKVLIRNLHLTV